MWVTIFRGSTVIGIIALLILLVNIANGAFGYALIEYEVSPKELANGGIAIEYLDKDTLIQVLQDNVSSGLFRRLENDKPFAERDQKNVYDLVIEWVLKPQVVQQWTLWDSILKQSEIRQEAEDEFPGLELHFISWLDTEFIINPQSGDPIKAGVRTAILGSLWTMMIAFLFSFPIGVGAAIYLEEYASQGRWINRVIQTNINNLAGVPSIIYGILGLAIFVRALEVFTSGSIFGIAESTENGRTILSAGLTLGLLILPLIIINSQQAIRAVPDSLRQASFGLGATRWQTIWSHVLPSALPGILTGTILAVSRAIGETAPLVVVGASTFITVDPDGPFSKFTTLPIQIYQWTSRPQDVFRNIAAAGIIVLLLLLLGMNTAAVVLRNRFSKRI
ncbi:MAG: phosphate ABC transporter permease PstA [Anaerolineales bacterium]